jgi:hypothetical protein
MACTSDVCVLTNTAGTAGYSSCPLQLLQPPADLSLLPLLLLLMRLALTVLLHAAAAALPASLPAAVLAPLD